MRTSTTTTCLAIGLAVTMFTPGARAVEGDLSRRQERPIVAQFNQVIRKHRNATNGHRRFFASQQRQIIQNINSQTLGFVFSGTGSALDTTFNTAITDTRSAIADLENIVIDFYDDNTNQPDSVVELGADLDSLLSAAIAKLNANNNRMTMGVGRGARAIERRACAKDLFLGIDILGMPEFVAPQFDRNVRAGSGETRHRANIVYTIAARDEPDAAIGALGYADIDDDDEFWWGLFEPDGTEIDTVQASNLFGNGTYRASFGLGSPGVKNLAVEIFDPDDGGLIFADGFESGDTSAWSYTGP